jgi:SAM-dependent methyltransferase
VPRETSKVRDRVLHLFTGRGADLGCGGQQENMPIDKLLPDSIAVDWQPGSDIVTNLEHPLPFEAGSLDYIWSSHTLEHLWSWQLALEEWVRVLRPGGVLGLYLPHADYYDNAWNSDHKVELRPEGVCQVLMRLGMVISMNELDVDDVPLRERPDRHVETERYSFLIVAVKQ